MSSRTAKFWTTMGTRFLPFADAATTELPLGRLLRLSLFQVSLGSFDHVVAMDSLIHYPAFEIVEVIRGLGDRTRGSIVFTFAPQTPLLMVALGMGRLFPRSDRSPAILPVRERLLRTLITNALPNAALGRDRKVSGGFYTSHALEVLPA